MTGRAHSQRQVAFFRVWNLLKSKRLKSQPKEVGFYVIGSHKTQHYVTLDGWWIEEKVGCWYWVEFSWILDLGIALFWSPLNGVGHDCALLQPKSGDHHLRCFYLTNWVKEWTQYLLYPYMLNIPFSKRPLPRGASIIVGWEGSVHV